MFEQLYNTILRIGLAMGISAFFISLTSFSSIAKIIDDMQIISHFSIDRTEVTIGQFAKFVLKTNLITKAENDGGGLVYAYGWEQKLGWVWHSPYGQTGQDDEPAVHVTFDEAEAFCHWAEKRLPTEQEWIEAAYSERRLSPPRPFISGKTYIYPMGNNPAGSNCLKECGKKIVVDRSDILIRGNGHNKVLTNKPGVNGLYDMGANVWEWVDISGEKYKGTRGGSWWYGANQMQVEHRVVKPRNMAVVYIGFRCVKDL